MLEFFDQAMAITYLAGLRLGTMVVKIFEPRQHFLGERIFGNQKSHEMDQLFSRGLADEMLDFATVDFRLRFGDIQDVAQERLYHRLLRHHGLDGFLPFRGELYHVMVVRIDPAAFFQGTEIDRHAAAGDVEMTGDVGNARPTTVFQADFVNAEEMMRGAMGELVGFEFLPSLHRRCSYNTAV